MAIKTWVGAKRRLNEVEREVERLEPLAQNLKELPDEEQRGVRLAIMVIGTKLQEVRDAIERIVAEGRAA